MDKVQVREVTDLGTGTRCPRIPPQQFRKPEVLINVVERNIDFDLSGLKDQSIPNSYLTGLARHLKFESMLKYVALPRLTLVSDDKSHAGKMNQ
jgi:hypothetical protein